MHCRSTHIHSTWRVQIQVYPPTSCYTDTCRTSKAPLVHASACNALRGLPGAGTSSLCYLSMASLSPGPSCLPSCSPTFPPALSLQVQPLWSIIPRTPFPLTLSHTDTVLGSEGFIGGSKAKQLPAYIPHTHSRPAKDRGEEWEGGGSLPASFLPLHAHNRSQSQTEAQQLK